MYSLRLGKRPARQELQSMPPLLPHLQAGTSKLTSGCFGNKTQSFRKDSTAPDSLWAWGRVCKDAVVTSEAATLFLLPLALYSPWNFSSRPINKTTWQTRAAVTAAFSLQWPRPNTEATVNWLHLPHTAMLQGGHSASGKWDSAECLIFVFFLQAGPSYKW